MLASYFPLVVHKVEKKVLWLQMNYPDEDENG